MGLFHKESVGKLSTVKEKFPTTDRVRVSIYILGTQTLLTKKSTALPPFPLQHFRLKESIGGFGFF
ncbi:unnamed protein product [Coffea canephora]|uniref:Uncharacterized protein n=1 Tax=Coffea canephora TaxID=49390 RepID=A0A068V9H9_COFCA|nr:unnamed protein product [Coffea canephora]